MKQFAALALILTVFTFGANAQCTPDPSITTPGFYPSGTDLPEVERCVFFDTVIQLKNFTTVDPADFGISGFPPVAINWLRLDNIAGLPAGLSYECVPNSCQFNAGVNGCIRIFGVTRENPGSFPLVIEGTVNALGQSIPGTSDQLGFTFVLDVVDNGALCPPFADITETLFSCSGQGILLPLVIDTGSGVAPFTYAWSPALGLDDSTLAQPTATPLVATDYTVTVTDVNNVTFTATTNVDVDNIPVPVADFNFAVTGGNTVEFTDLSSNGTNVSWYFGNGSTSSSASPNHVFDSIAEYTVTLVVSNNCGSDTTVKTLSITGITDVKGKDLTVGVYPNPTKGLFSVTLNGTTAKATQVFVYDMQGRLVQSGALQSKGSIMTSVIDLSGNGNGIYIVKVISGSQASTHKLVVQ